MAATARGRTSSRTCASVTQTCRLRPPRTRKDVSPLFSVLSAYRELAESTHATCRAATRRTLCPRIARHTCARSTPRRCPRTVSILFVWGLTIKIPALSATGTFRLRTRSLSTSTRSTPTPSPAVRNVTEAVTDLLAHMCSICNSGYRYRSDLFKHMRKEHGRSPTPEGEADSISC